MWGNDARHEQLESKATSLLSPVPGLTRQAWLHEKTLFSLLVRESLIEHTGQDHRLRSFATLALGVKVLV